MQKEYSFSDLSTADLFVDAIYKGGSNGNAGDDPISKLLSCGNQGGFRFVGSAQEPRMCILYSDLTQPDWPDELNYENGFFIYFGDNRQPGEELHQTRKKGNNILRFTFDALHTGERNLVPPIFVFTKAEHGRDVTFRGLVVPGAEGINQTEDLVAIWKSVGGQRFQNYKALFTILDVEKITRKWIQDIHAGKPFSSNAPVSWIKWIKSKKYSPLQATRTIKHRTKLEQQPSSKLENQIVDCIVSYFKNHANKEFAFEKCAAEIAKMLDDHIINYTLTRPWRDGGRDAIGVYEIGSVGSTIKVDFALEAKCHQVDRGAGVRETSRLISRLRHRQFGIFVTTSFVEQQAYKEIIEDRHPIIIISGGDIAKILVRCGINTKEAIADWLKTNY